MKLLALAVGVGALLPLSSAYFSEGWQPGQPVTKYLTATSSAPNAVPTAPGVKAPPKEPFDWKKFKFEHLLTGGPIGTFVQGLGLNLTERLEKAREGIPSRFNEAIPLITDDNYESMLFNETFSSPQEEADRVWVILVLVDWFELASTLRC